MLNRTAATCLIAMAVSASALAGELNPPAGPVTSTGRFGPRTEITQANTPGDANSLFKITAPGSYYLGGNVTGVVAKHGVEIASSGVTLDLMGFELLGVPDSLDGGSVTITSPAFKNVHIRGGSVRDWGDDGVDIDFVRTSSLRGLLAADNGSAGLVIGTSGIVVACAAESNGGDGIRARFSCTISGCAASFNSAHGISAGAVSTIYGCAARTNLGHGISADGSCTISGNTAYFNGGTGIFAGSTCMVSENTAPLNAGDGIQVGLNCLVLNNACDGHGFGNGDGAGIHATGADNRIEGNNVTVNDRGIDVDAAGNLIIRNSASGSTVAYDIVVGNAFGSFQDFSGGGAIISNVIAGNGFNLPNAWSNFIY